MFTSNMAWRGHRGWWNEGDACEDLDERIPDASRVDSHVALPEGGRGVAAPICFVNS